MKDYFHFNNMNLPHGVMFHHFHHNSERPYAQGSITSNQLRNIIKYIGPEHIIPADIWLERAIKGKLSKRDICLTFDDSLKCQKEIAYPVLKEFNLKAFWFVFSSVFDGHIFRLEIYRYFYNTYFDDFEEFFKIFKDYMLRMSSENMSSKKFIFLESNYLKEFKHYSDIEREYRYYRDKVLNRTHFEKIMDKILYDHGVEVKDFSKNFWMDNSDLLELDLDGHIIGLHSYSHPTNMASLDIEMQKEEYIKNKDHLKSLIDQPLLTIAHPCGSYNRSTFKILDELGIKIGFRSNFKKLEHTSLEYPRMDHNHIIKLLD